MSEVQIFSDEAGVGREKEVWGKIMRDLQSLHRDFTEVIIQTTFRYKVEEEGVENFPPTFIIQMQEMATHEYLNNPVFAARVKQLAAHLIDCVVANDQDKDRHHGKRKLVFDKETKTIKGTDIHIDEANMI